MNILNLVVSSAVLTQQKFTSKKLALKALSRRAAKLSGLDMDQVFVGLEAREKLGSTAMGNGVAVPHCRMPTLGRSFALFALLETPIEFGALDQQPVDIVCMLLSADAAPTEHLRALACISRLLRDRTLCSRLRGCAEPEAAFSLLTQTVSARAA